MQKSGRKKGPRADKVRKVEELRNLFDAAQAAIVTEYRGLSMAEMTILRRKLAPIGAEYHVTKNTLMRRAVGDKLTPELEAILGGPTAIAFANEDPAGCAKALLDFIRDTRKTDIVVRGGYMGGKIITPEHVTALSKIPPRPVVLGQTVGAIQGPLTGFAGTMNGVLSEFVRTLQAVADKQGAAA